jgi:glycosyltransferase involved in cell wall biosynthesis
VVFRIFINLMIPMIPQISIIIPAYNEERRLPRALQQIFDWLRKRSLDAEVIVVDDGSSDTTATIVTDWSQRFPALRLISNGRNLGKGESVRRGMLAACGTFTLFTDADLSAPIEEAEKLLAALDRHHIAIGSRAMDRSLIEIRQSRLRELAGRLFNRLVRMVAGLSFQDTQCGFKAFVRDRTRILFELQRIRGFGFDPEILYLARRCGLRTVEVPVRWAHDPGSRVRMFRDRLRMFWDLVSTRYNWLVGRYQRTPLTRTVGVQPSQSLDAKPKQLGVSQ